MAMGGVSFNSPRPVRPPTPSAAGPVQGLRSAAPSGGGGGMLTGAARREISHRQMEESRHQPRLNADGSWSFNTAARPEGYDREGRPIYGFGNTSDTPQNFVTPPNQVGGFGPGGPGSSRGPGMGGPFGPMGGLMAEAQPVAEVAAPPPVDDSAAVAAAYGRAKDVAGQQGRAALNSLMDLQGARGIQGSPLGINEAGGVINAAASQLGDINREQLIQRVENERRRNEMIYSGLINQRSQNISQRGQELDRRRFNASNSPYGHIQGAGVNPVPAWPRF